MELVMDGKVKKGYKMTEIGILPEDWEVTSMANLFKFKNGVNADKTAYGSGIKFINVMDVFNNQEIVWTGIIGKVELNKTQMKTYKVSKYDILFNRTSETFEEIALASIYLDNEDVVFGGFVIRGIHISKKLYPKFSQRVLHSFAVRNQIILRAQGAIRANISQSDLSKVLLPLPPLPEQKAIAQVLSDTDALIQSLEKQIGKKRLIKVGAMQELLRAREGWEVVPLSSITTLMTNGFVGIATSHYTKSDNGVLYIQGYNVEENSFNFRGIKRVNKEFHNNHLKSRLREGDLLTVQTGNVGLTTIVPKELEGSNCHALIITRFKKYLAFPKFYAFYLNSFIGRAGLREIETGTTMKHINVGHMIHFLVPKPSLEEQTRIATILSDMDDEIESLEKKLSKYKELKQGLMQQLLTGKIRLV